MATQLKLRRGTTAQHSTFVGGSGEITVDTTKKTVVVHDGATSGGTPLATESALSSKQDALVSGTNIKTINSASLLGSGNISVTGVPEGAVAYFARDTAPTGWLKANGAAISRTTYAALFAAIGTTFGAGDGSTTFNIPDLRGEFPRGWDDGRGVDTSRTFGSAQAAAFASHSHTGTTNTDPGHTHNLRLAGGTPIATSGASTNSASSANVSGGFVLTGGAHSHTVTTDSTGGTETRPRNIALLACIKF